VLEHLHNKVTLSVFFERNCVIMGGEKWNVVSFWFSAR
jgi:hypothetical protein